MKVKKQRYTILIASALILAIAANLMLIPVSAQTSMTVSDFAKTGLKNETISFTAADFSSHYNDTRDPAQPLQKIRITQLPEATAGLLKTGDTVIDEDAEIPVDNLASLIFVPVTDWIGATAFKWQGSDGTDYSENEATVSITIEEPAVVNQPPTASDLSISTQKNTPVTGKLPATDPEGDSLTFIVVAEPQKGTVTLTDAATGDFTYTPDNNATGVDSFQFKANDGNADSNIADIVVTITVPEPPPFVYADLVNHWANFSAGKLAERGLIVGEKIAGKYYFYPDKIMTRAEFNLFLNAALEIDSDTLGSEPVGYADENKIPIWVLHEARAAKRENLINGVKVGNKVFYRANDKLTRIETLVILHNALKPTANNNEPLTYVDKAAIPKWAVQHVKNMRGYGIIKGNPGNTFKPSDTITRAQAAELLYQLIKYLEANQQ